MGIRSLRYGIFVCLLCGTANATSIVVQVDSGRIFIAADTRGAALTPGVATAFHETECKIVPLGNAAFAVTGNEDYVQTQQNDLVASWNSRSDAREAYTEHKDDLIATSDEWAARAVRHYLFFYFINPARVQELAQVNSEHVLLEGLFAGFQAGQAILILRYVYLNEGSLSPILDSKTVVPVRTLPYTSNGITQELIEGHSERTEAAKAAWKNKLASIPIANREFRQLEFLVQFTHNYDESVGQRVNIMEVFPQKKPLWLQNFTCARN